MRTRASDGDGDEGDRGDDGWCVQPFPVGGRRRGGVVVTAGDPLDGTSVAAAGGVPASLLARALEHLAEAVTIMTAERGGSGATIIYANRAFTRLTGYESDELVGSPAQLLDGPGTDGR